MKHVYLIQSISFPDQRYVGMTAYIDTPRRPQRRSIAAYREIPPMEAHHIAHLYR